MKPSDIEPPFYMQHLPMQRGYPVPWSSIKLPNGQYDVTTSDPAKWDALLHSRACGVCGIVLKEKVWFIGGPKCMTFRLFFDHPMHEECARYALEVCPYLAMPKYLGAKSHAFPEELRLQLNSSDKTKPTRFGLAPALHYRGAIFQGDKLLQVEDDWLQEPEWFDALRHRK